MPVIEAHLILARQRTTLEERYELLKSIIQSDDIQKSVPTFYYRITRTHSAPKDMCAKVKRTQPERTGAVNKDQRPRGIKTNIPRRRKHRNATSSILNTEEHVNQEGGEGKDDVQSLASNMCHRPLLPEQKHRLSRREMPAAGW